jgi:hypothetical protein
MGANVAHAASGAIWFAQLLWLLNKAVAEAKAGRKPITTGDKDFATSIDGGDLP